MKKVKLSFSYAGYCYALEKYALRNGKKREIKFHALWVLILHPEQGYMLFDTGYTERFYEASRKYPNKIYANKTRVKVGKEDEVISILKRNGISAEEIKHVIISHFHADHIGGLKDFPNAHLHCTRKAFEHTMSLSSFTAFSKGVLKDLLPVDLSKRLSFIEEEGQEKNDEIFGLKYDLFGDDSIYIYNLPGHAAGQIGVMVESQKNKYFLIADACWLKASYEKMVLPHPIVRLFFHSWKEFKQTLKLIWLFHQTNTDVQIIPTHCQETSDPLILDEIDMNAF